MQRAGDEDQFVGEEGTEFFLGLRTAACIRVLLRGEPTLYPIPPSDNIRFSGQIRIIADLDQQDLHWGNL